MTPSYTFRPQRNAGGYDVILFGTDTLVDVAETRFKAEHRVRELNQYARNAKYFKRDASKRIELSDHIKDEILDELKEVKHGQKIEFWARWANQLDLSDQHLQVLVRQHRRERGL